MSIPPPSPWADESMWLPEEPRALQSERIEGAEEAVRSLGFPHHTSFAVSQLGEYLLELRPCSPGSRFPAPGAPSYVVGPDSRVFIVPALPGTSIVAAEQVLTERYASGLPIAEPEHSQLETRIRHLARDLSGAWG